MGAKGLKAIVIDQQGKSADAIADPDAFKEAAKAFAQAIKAHPMTGEMLPALGADEADEPLRHDHEEGRGEEVGLDPEVEHTGDRARRVVRVEGAENQVSC